MAEQPPEEQGNPEAPPEAAPGPMGAGAAVAAGDVGQAAQATFPQPATSQGQDATPSTREDPIWISKREVRRTAPRSSGSKKTTYFIEFYLVDNHGYETLAATGEDQGDAHYTYKNARDFRLYGNMEVHNRKELLQWLDKIIEGTQKAHNFHLVSDDEDVLCQSVAVAPGSPVKLPTFVATREHKSHDEGGRRRQQWWLVDDNSHEHLAVVGEERDPRDGHYNYYAEKPFSLICPLACQNRTKVHEYLEAFITHPGEEPHSYTASPKKPLSQELPGARPGHVASSQAQYLLGAPDGQAKAAGGLPDAQRSAPRSSAGSHAKRATGGSGRGKGDTGHKGSKSGKASKKGMKRSASFAFGVADGEPGMRRRSVNEEEAAESAAQEAVTAELQRRAATRAAWQSAARRGALEWLRAPVSEGAGAAVTEWQRILQGALSELYAPTPSPTVPVLAPPPFSMMAPGGLGLHPNGMGDMRLSEETAGLLPLSSAGGSLPMMLNGLLAHGNAQSYQQQQQGSSQPTPGFSQQGASIPTPAMIAGGGNAQPPIDGPRVNALALTEALDAMRELASLHPTLPLFAAMGLLDTFKQLAQHHEPSIASLATATLEHWKKVWAHHLNVLTDPSYLADPRAEAQAVLKAITDHVAAEKRRREPKTPVLSMRSQMNGTSLSVPGSMAPGSLPAASSAALPAGEPPAERAAPAQSQTMLHMPPPSALALISLPDSAGPSSMPEGSAPHSAAPSLNLLAFLQSSGGLSGATPASLLSAISAGMQSAGSGPLALPTPIGQTDQQLAKVLEGRRLQFATPAGSGSAPAEVLPGGAAAGVAAEISGLSPLLLAPPAVQGESSDAPGGLAISRDGVTGQRSQRDGSRLRLGSAGTGSQDGPPGTATERTKRRLETSPADAAVLKEVGLTSDEESGNAWGCSGEEDGLKQDVNKEQGPQDQSLDATASFLHRQKGRLAECKHREVPAIAEAAASQALASLQTAVCSQQTLQQANAASERIRVHAGKLSKDAQPEANSSAKAELEQALQHLIDIVEEKRGVE